ncbi:transglycosylase SLT domain-containing protein [Streptomyces sp. NPDC092296]|uniref:aggregation-promoting factor C-terminal-like domain-containing protein n=1 Tax=Streptomyces sp. NPDC092296 TaxID=3366012 RepID=UPI0038061843
MPRLRSTAAVVAAAASLGAVAAVAAPAASAATMSAHRLHLHHVNHVNHTAGAHHAAKAGLERSAVAAPVTAGGVRGMAQSIVPAGQWAAFDAIVSHESGWNPSAVNASSGAYGLGQALPGSKMAAAGSDWKTNPATQAKWALSYMNDRYGSPNNAWAFWQTHHWY